MERNKLILISFDALSVEDIEYLKAKKNFAYILENGSWVRRVHGIYPTLTYPSHATMIPVNPCPPADSVVTVWSSPAAIR